MVGVGYRSTVTGRTLTVNVGLSHPVEMPIPTGIEVRALRPVPPVAAPATRPAPSAHVTYPLRRLACPSIAERTPPRPCSLRHLPHVLPCPQHYPPILPLCPSSRQVSVEKNTIITVSGYDKEAVGQFSAKIRSKREPEPYKGKGIKYSDEIVRRKEGKRGK
jgi:hypothetical protein